MWIIPVPNHGSESNVDIFSSFLLHLKSDNFMDIGNTMPLPFSCRCPLPAIILVVRVTFGIPRILLYQHPYLGSKLLHPCQVIEAAKAIRRVFIQWNPYLMFLPFNKITCWVNIFSGSNQNQMKPLYYFPYWGISVQKITLSCWVRNFLPSRTHTSTYHVCGQNNIWFMFSLSLNCFCTAILFISSVIVLEFSIILFVYICVETVSAFQYLYYMLYIF